MQQTPPRSYSRTDLINLQPNEKSQMEHSSHVRVVFHIIKYKHYTNPNPQINYNWNITDYLFYICVFTEIICRPRRIEQEANMVYGVRQTY